MRTQDLSESSFSVLVLAWIYRFALALIMAAGLCIFTTLTLNSLMFLIVLGAYFAILLTLHQIYQACDAGIVRVSELIIAQTLSNLMGVVMIYISISLYAQRWTNIVPWLGVFAAQEILSVAWCFFANAMYFHRYTAPRTAVLYSSEAMLQLIYETPYFQEKYHVCKLIKNPSGDLKQLLPDISGCPVLFCADVSAGLANELATYCVENRVKGFFVPSLGHIIISGAEYISNFSAPMLKVQRSGGRSSYRALKRVFDIAVSLVGIVVTAPIMLVTALCIFCEDHGPVFYRQTRLTRNGREFSILKFRSMTVNAEKDGVARLAGQNDSRITKVGRFIRSCRIDELPQLFNILFGDMSIVGPRPERPEIAKQYEKVLPEFSLRLQVKAGLTGLAQVYGRYNTEPYHKLQMDLMYINRMSHMTDLKLIMATLKILFVKESTAGIQAGRTTAGCSDEKKQSA